MPAGLILASLGRRLTVRAMPALGAVTTVAARSTVLARSTVEARMMGTVIQFPLTVGSCKPRGAAARVRTLSSVEACPAMSAWLMVCAVIEILVAEQAAPTFIAEAVPGLLAGPVETSWIPLALVTKPPFPSAVAQAFVGLVAVSMLIVTTRQAARFCAVISLPARQTDTITGGGAFVVAEVVVPRTTQVGTASAVIMCVARDSVLVPHHGMRREMFFLRPVLPHVQKPLCCQARDQLLPAGS